MTVAEATINNANWGNAPRQVKPTDGQYPTRPSLTNYLFEREQFMAARANGYKKAGTIDCFYDHFRLLRARLYIRK